MIRIATQVLIFTFFLFVTTALKAQPEYIFKGGTLASGTSNKIGAVYFFPSVKAGVDATITITNITGGVTLISMDGSAGFNDALQPVISIPALKNGYVEFKIDFFNAGTTIPNKQKEVPVTPINVDGQKYASLPLYEYDEIYSPDGYTYFQMAGSELAITMNNSWARGKNKASVEYPGIDTIRKEVMFTTINVGISTLLVRVGADNQSKTDAVRSRSLYFKKFKYPSEIILPNRTLLSFNGCGRNNQVELKGLLSSSHNYDKIIIEKCNSSMQFSNVAELPITNEGSSEFPFTFIDKNSLAANNYYRVRLVNTKLGVIEISNILMINMDKETTELQLVNSIVKKESPMLTLISEKAATAKLQLTDFNGRILCSKNLNLNSGLNIINFDAVKIPSGFGFVTIEKEGVLNNFKIIVQ